MKVNLTAKKTTKTKSRKESRTTSKSQTTRGGRGDKQIFKYISWACFLGAIMLAIGGIYDLWVGISYSAYLAGYESYLGYYGGFGTSYMIFYGVGLIIGSVIALAIGLHFRKKAR